MLSAESSGREDFRWEGRRSCSGARLPCAQRRAGCLDGTLISYNKADSPSLPSFLIWGN